MTEDQHSLSARRQNEERRTNETARADFCNGSFLPLMCLRPNALKKKRLMPLSMHQVRSRPKGSEGRLKAAQAGASTRDSEINMAGARDRLGRLN